MDGGRKGMEYGACTCTRGSAQAITSGGRILKALLLHFCALYVLINSQKNKWISVVGKIYLSGGQISGGQVIVSGGCSRPLPTTVGTPLVQRICMYSRSEKKKCLYFSVVLRVDTVAALAPHMPCMLLVYLGSYSVLIK